MNKKTFTGIALGSSVALAALSGVALAEDNPFAVKQLTQGYQLADGSKGMEGNCGEGKCGAKEEKKSDGKCGANDDKKAEGKCGAKEEDKKSEGKCGEGKCGGKG